MEKIFLKQSIIYINDWEKNRIETLKIIRKSFKEINKLAIRSSGTLEDTEESSNAGAYESILNVKNNNQDITKSINKVINLTKPIKPKVLIQPMLSNVDVSGVVFTRDLKMELLLFY